MRISDWSSDVCSSDLSAQPVAEILVPETFDLFESVAVAVPQPDRRQRHTVESVGFDHRIMCLIEKGDPLPRLSWHRQAVIADNIARKTGRAAQADGSPCEGRGLRR